MGIQDGRHTVLDRVLPNVLNVVIEIASTPDDVVAEGFLPMKMRNVVVELGIPMKSVVEVDEGVGPPQVTIYIVTCVITKSWRF